jgi:hypothetical protein
MVRFTHHDMAFHGLALQIQRNHHRILAKSHVMMTPAAQLRACSGRHLTGIHGAIREMVRFTHHDMAFHGLALQIQRNQRRATPKTLSC